MLHSLFELLEEPIELVIRRERNALGELLAICNNRVVLFGTGNLGRRAAGLLRGIGVEPLAFSDNNSNRWGTVVENLPVLAPAVAAERYGADSTLLVTIWNEFHWFSETQEQMRALGCSHIAPYLPLYWRFSSELDPLLLNGLPHVLYEDRKRVLEAEGIWNDPESQDLYRANIRMRALGDLSGMPGRPTENTYLPQDIFQLSDEERILDCGATGGEMSDELLNKRGPHFASFHAIEADRTSFKKLQKYHEQLPEEVRHKFKTYNLAVGDRRGVVLFSNTGGTGSKISETGISVECVPIDELFRDTPLTLMKMDIEGAEFDSLIGARRVIQRDKPTLAICVYHTQSDIWRIPLLVRELLPEHNLFLRAYEGDGYQNVMFAVPPERAIRAQW